MLRLNYRSNQTNQTMDQAAFRALLLVRHDLHAEIRGLSAILKIRPSIARRCIWVD